MEGLTMRYEYSRKPVKCPKCKSTKIAEILYGLPAYSKELQAKMDEDKIVLGGCCVSSDDPKWQCIKCKTVFYQKLTS
jgi:phage FluMu protein Com